jgi:hypothetical protein
VRSNLSQGLGFRGWQGWVRKLFKFVDCLVALSYISFKRLFSYHGQFEFGGAHTRWFLQLCIHHRFCNFLHKGPLVFFLEQLGEMSVVLALSRWVLRHQVTLLLPAFRV